MVPPFPLIGLTKKGRFKAVLQENITGAFFHGAMLGEKKDFCSLETAPAQ